MAAGALPAGMTSEDVIENSRADWSSAAPAGGAVEALAVANRIRAALHGHETWRVMNADETGYCAEFASPEYLDPQRQCGAWLARQNPEWIKRNGYHAVKSFEFEPAERMALEAAEALAALAAAPALPAQTRQVQTVEEVKRLAEKYAAACVDCFRTRNDHNEALVFSRADSLHAAIERLAAAPVVPPQPSMQQSGLSPHGSDDLSTLRGWISVSERMPQFGVKVLAYCESWGTNADHPFLAHHGGAIGFIDTRRGSLMGGVTHWMPLPAPPEANRGAPAGATARADGADQSNSGDTT
jgi:hypothetical protein